MSVVETILVFVIVPAAVVGVLALLIWGRNSIRGSRYRPGREWRHEAVWYAPHPLAVRAIAPTEPQLGRMALTAGSASSGATGNGAAGVTAAGGARGTW